MRLLVCGSRDWTDREAIRDRITALKPDLIIEGAARGADTLAGEIADELGIPKLVFPAAWGKYGKAAGSIRNAQMLREGKPDMVLAFPLPGSRGTKDMIWRAKAAGVTTEIYGEDVGET